MLRVFATLVLVATAALKAQATLPANCSRTATVASGDTCNSIGAENNAPTYQIIQANPGVINAQCTNLYPGEVICLGITGQDCQITHAVVTGDTCTQIANEYNIPLATLYANNPTINSGCTNLYVGEVLCVSSTIYNSTTSA